MASGDSVLTSSFKFDAIGTSWEINTPAPLGSVTRAQILDLVERFDSIYSRFRRDSVVTRIAKAADGGTFSFPADARPIFDLYDRLHDATDGAFDPLVGRDLELYGYDRDYTLVPDDEGIAATTAHRPVWRRDVQREGNTITTRGPLVVDVSAVGKGRLVDLYPTCLRLKGSKTALSMAVAISFIAETPNSLSVSNIPTIRTWSSGSPI